MTAPMVALVLCLIHVSLLVGATMLVRVCVARRLAASRAAIGAVGMSCILLVTGLALLPIPSVWSNPDRAAAQNAEDAKPTSETQVATVANSTSAKQSHLTQEANAQFAISLSWLRRVGDRLGDVTAAASAAPRGWRDILIACLLCGAMVSAGRLLSALSAVRQLYQSSTLIADERVVTMAAALQNDCGCRRPIELRQTDQLSCAATFGFLQPVILLPTGWAEWSEEELAAALAHEVAHVRRDDYLQRLIARLAETVYFFHPLVWAASHQLAADQEFAADRLAGSLRSEPAYLLGLAKLALRCHDSFPSDRAGSRIAFIPKSSDFLARRLEMLRTKNVTPSKRLEWLVSWITAGSVLAIALAVTLLRGPAVSAETPAAAATPVEIARRIQPSIEADKPAPDSGQDDSLFAREPFDVSIIPHAEDGAFLIRVAAILQHPEIQPNIDSLNEIVAENLRYWIKNADISIDLRQIEWVAGSMTTKVEPPKKQDDEARLMFGCGGTVIRMATAGNWQAAVLKRVPGSSLETLKGLSYVRLPVIPALGPAPLKLQFLDDNKTIVAYYCLTKEISFDFDISKPSPQPYAWAKTWRAVEGGLVTVVCENEKVGWSALPEEKRDWQEFTPLVEQVKCYALGLDWTEKSHRLGVQIRGTGADGEAVTAIHLSAATLLNRWILARSQSFGERDQPILQFLSSVRFRPSPVGDDEHFVHAKADVTLSLAELLGIFVPAD